MTHNRAWNRRKLSSHTALPNENVVGQNVIDAANGGVSIDGGLYFAERDKGGKAASKFADSVCDQLHHRTMYAPVKTIQVQS